MIRDLLAPYDDIEVHPCVLLDDRSYEQCAEDDPQIVVWTVYGHLIEGGLEWIADFDAANNGKEFALDYAGHLMTALKVSTSDNSEYRK